MLEKEKGLRILLRNAYECCICARAFNTQRLTAVFLHFAEERVFNAQRENR